jgi:hypothetical protein
VLWAIQYWNKTTPGTVSVEASRTVPGTTFVCEVVTKEAPGLAPNRVRAGVRERAQADRADDAAGAEHHSRGDEDQQAGVDRQPAVAPSRCGGGQPRIAGGGDDPREQVAVVDRGRRRLA